MKKIIFILSILIVIISGCSTSNYFVYQTDSNIDLQPTKYNVVPYMQIPKGKHIVVKESKSSFKKAQYGNHKGYICGITNLSNPIRISAKDIQHLKFNPSDLSYYYKGEKLELGTSIKHSQSYSPSQHSTGTGTVHVKGYYRKNGTYVRPHTRTAPSRRR